MARFVATSVRMRPLLPDGVPVDASLEAVLRVARRDLMRRLKRKLTQTTFSAKAKAALSKALKIETKPASLVVTVNHPAFGPLVRGQRKRQMTWLKRSRRPIPIITETGKLIFRSAHARSLTWRNGPMTGPNVGKKKGWMHPGREQSDFVERAKTEAREFLKEKFKKELLKQVQRSLQKQRR